MIASPPAGVLELAVAVMPCYCITLREAIEG